MKITTKNELRQGTISDDNEDMILAICSKDDIRWYAEDHDIDLTEKDVDDVFQYMVRRGSGLITENNFWDVIDISINVTMEESK